MVGEEWGDWTHGHTKKHQTKIQVSPKRDSIRVLPLLSITNDKRVVASQETHLHRLLTQEHQLQVMHLVYVTYGWISLY